eukprot:CAMPEP_0174901688 /NCGR_PEP_ID=MMETSP0167-20121228/35377_1 /TAXON_ID=38298 /ORGANISM="Rhodella maculata, Strain CCMP736" /LENGTH=108 /DNA_ID=CAMNT_0016143435 /DNA_START=235 /DNA_END=562 /DNA_ORIENTATION=-
MAHLKACQARSAPPTSEENLPGGADAAIAFDLEAEVCAFRDALAFGEVVAFPARRVDEVRVLGVEYGAVFVLELHVVEMEAACLLCEHDFADERKRHDFDDVGARRHP